LCCASALAAETVSILIPSVSGPLAIDGKLDDAAWQSARVLGLASSEFGPPFPVGGEVRIAARGKYLCLSARIPEPDRPVAHSTGRNPDWWSEDLIIWTFRVYDGGLRRNVHVSLAVNPLGAWRFQNSITLEPLKGAETVLVAVNRDSGQWMVEAAIPLDRLARNGFASVERIRAPRPVAPELRWHWPAANERAVFALSELNREPAPEFRPAQRLSLGTSRPEGKPVTALGWIPKTVWTAEQRDRLRVSGMLENSLRARMSVIAGQEKLAWQRVNSRESWERFRDQRLAALRKSLEPFPERTPLRPVVTHRADYGDGFVIENIVFESRPNLLVTANLYLPANPSSSVPAIIVAHAHHAPKTQSELQDLGMTWARSGTAVLVMDQLCAGERSQSQPWYRESYYGRYTLGNQLLVAGESLMKWMVWDLMRSVDLLLERPYIDPKRIIMLGAVAGGGDPAAVTAALDPRIAAVIPFNFGEAGPEEHYTLGPRGYDFDTAWPGWGEWETTRSMPRSAVDQFFPWMICASVAPRHFLYSFEIGWPQDVEQEPVWTRYKKVFDLYGARDHLDEVDGFGPFPGPGECTNVGTFLRRKIYPILERWLKISVPALEYHRNRPESELMCLTPAVAAERKPKSASSIALELARGRLAQARSGISPAAEQKRRSQLRMVLREKLGDIEPLVKPAVQTLWDKSGAQATVEALVIESEGGITLPVLLLKPVKPAAARAPAVLAIAAGGKARFLSERGEEVTSLLGNGIAVCLPDLRGIGELAETQSRGPESMALAVSEFMLGETLLGARLKDTRTVFHYLASRPDIDPARIALWGESFAEMNADDFAFDQSYLQAAGEFVQHQAEPMGALLALLTGLYEDRVAAVAARGGLVSFVSVLEDRFSHVPQDVIVPRVLEAADVSDIVAAQNSRPVLLEGFVDGRNILAGNARLQSEFGAALKTSTGLITRPAAGEPALASWLASRGTQKEK
jgi:dienelactone hydrolase